MNSRVPPLVVFRFIFYGINFSTGLGPGLNLIAAASSHFYLCAFHLVLEKISLPQEQSLLKINPSAFLINPYAVFLICGFFPLPCKALGVPVLDLQD